MPLEPNLIATAAVTTAIGWTMLYSGRRKRMLTPRRRPRRCPSCGRLLGRKACDRH